LETNDVLHGNMARQRNLWVRPDGDGDLRSRTGYRPDLTIGVLRPSGSNTPLFGYATSGVPDDYEAAMIHSRCECIAPEAA
jgi:hypothetical protein